MVYQINQREKLNPANAMETKRKRHCIGRVMKNGCLPYLSNGLNHDVS